MEIATWFGAAFLGVVEGLTEFVPVSSTGHLILLIDLIGFRGPPGKVFEIVIQLGAILAVCWAYRARLLGVVTGALSAPDDFRFLRNILLAFVPTMVIGALAHGYIKNVLFDPLVVSAALIAGGMVILAIERSLPASRHHAIERFPMPLALAIGLCQTVAMIPGVSRSGATIMGAVLLRVERKTATEFSFFLAIPTMLGATAYDIYKNWSALTVDGIAIIVVGFFAAFLAALVVVRGVIAFIARHGFVPFAWYRIAIGVLILVLLTLR
ncbi:MAG TPA: undecaprenyl-diphosphate phosphatase [Alphaproteobacteria bacterium]